MQGLFLQEVYYFISLFQQLAERDSLPKWALTSFPGSGVTWTRQMIEGITGIYTGSVHEQDPSPVQVEGTVNVLGGINISLMKQPLCNLHFA